MMLTQRQQMLIARYLREVGDALGDVSDDTRERVLRRVKNRIVARLGQDGGVMADEDIVAALAFLGKPTDQAFQALQERGTHQGLVLSAENRRWLGVCSGLADYLGLNPTAVRTFFILFGVTGPVCLIAYMALYAEMYIVSPPERAPRIDFWRLLGRTVSTLVAAVALHEGARGFLLLMRRAYERFAGLGPFPDMGQWNWLPFNAPFMFFCAMSLSLPLALLSGLPMANEWDRTLRRCSLAILALYAAALSIGIALFLTGLILRVAKGVAL